MYLVPSNWILAAITSLSPSEAENKGYERVLHILHCARTVVSPFSAV